MLTNSLTHSLMHNSMAMGLFSSLFDVTRPEMCLFTNRRTYNACIIDLPLSSFVFQFFSLTTQGVDSR